MPSCGHILQADSSATTGVYTINPTGGDPFSVYCDMTTDGGGWELITARETNVLSSTTSSIVMPTSNNAVTDARLLPQSRQMFQILFSFSEAKALVFIADKTCDFELIAHSVKRVSTEPVSNL